MEIKAKHNIPLITINNVRMKVAIGANVLQHSESKVKQN